MFWDRVYGYLVKKKVLLTGHTGLEICTVTECVAGVTFAVCVCDETKASYTRDKAELMKKHIEYLCRDLSKIDPANKDNEDVENPSGVKELAIFLANCVRTRKEMIRKTRKEWEALRDEGLELEKRTVENVEGQPRNEERRLNIRKQRDRINSRKKQLRQAERSLTSDNGISSAERVCEYLNVTLGLQEYSRGVNRRTLSDWGLKEHALLQKKPKKKYLPDRIGRKALLSNSMELELAQRLTEMEACGLAVSKQDLISLGKELINDEGDDERLSKWLGSAKPGPSDSWLRMWEKKYVDLGFVQLMGMFVRHEAKRTVKWFTNANLKTWFENLKFRLSKLNVLDESSLNWKYPNRVVFMSEINLLLGADTKPKNQHYAQLLVKRKRKLHPPGEMPAEIVTLLFGHNLLNELLSPFWLVPVVDHHHLSAYQLKKLIATTNKLSIGPVNGQSMSVSRESFIATTNAAPQELTSIDMLVKLLKNFYPDAKEKGVVVFYSGDFGGNTSLCWQVLSELKDTGIHFHFVPKKSGVQSTPLDDLEEDVLDRTFLDEMMTQLGGGKNGIVVSKFKQVEASVKAMNVFKTTKQHVLSECITKTGLATLNSESFVQHFGIPTMIENFQVSNAPSSGSSSNAASKQALLTEEEKVAEKAKQLVLRRYNNQIESAAQRFEEATKKAKAQLQADLITMLQTNPVLQQETLLLSLMQQQHGQRCSSSSSSSGGRVLQEQQGTSTQQEEQKEPSDGASSFIPPPPPVPPIPHDLANN